MSMHRNVLLVPVLIASLAVLVKATSMFESTRNHPPSVLLIEEDSLRGIPCGGGDNPPTTYFSWSGNGGVTVDVVGDTIRSGTFRVRGIPEGAGILWASMYGASWGYRPNDTASAEFRGVTLPYVLPFECDTAPSYVLCAFRWDVTSLVSGNGDYDYSVSWLPLTYGEALVVIYSHASEPARKVLVNHGSEALMLASSSSVFADIESDSATLFIFTQADDTTGSAEAVHFNGEIIAGPGSVFHWNRGKAASLLEFSVECTTGTNTVTCVTDVDYFGWHLAILETYGLPIEVITVTGGGWVVGGRVGSNSKKTFGFNARSESGVCLGQLQFNDHALGIKVHSDSLRGLTVSGDTSASFEGHCRVNGITGYGYKCAVRDRGEPGRKGDSFDLRIFTTDGNPYYSDGGLLGGGNIQIRVEEDPETRAACSASDIRLGFPSDTPLSAQPDLHSTGQTNITLWHSPNPFRRWTEISYFLPTSRRIVLEVYDVTGKHLGTLADGRRAAGLHTVRWDSRDSVSGVYFYSLRVGEFVETRKMVVLE